MKTKYSQTREELLLKLINRKEPTAVNDYGTCFYSHRFNGGCAIGCDIRPSLAEKLDETHSGVSYDSAFYLLPKRLQKMGQGFLTDVQLLHDGFFGQPSFKSEVNRVIKKYELDIDLL